VTPQPDDKDTKTLIAADLPTKTPHAVLAVDDDPNIRRALKRTLHGEPYELVVADSGAHALELLKDRSIQVVVSDLSMPEMDGMTLLAKVAERAPDVIRLILSGRSVEGANTTSFF
jgi:DNA-binding NtrC family response regulator